MPNAHIDDTVIVHKDRFAYISHPSIAVLADGRWLAAFNHSRRREPRAHPPGDPFFRTLLTSSADHGATWCDPWFAPDFDWYGTECPGIAQLRDGTVLLTQFRFNWYPLGLARKRRAAGERISIRPQGGSWTEQFDEQDWARSMHTWARANRGVYSHLSRDGGDTFEHTATIDCDPYIDGYSRTGVCELVDDRLAYALTEHHPPNCHNTFIVFSADGGASWQKPVLIAREPNSDFGEPDIAEVAPGRLTCILRTSGHGDLLYGCHSADGGRTWTDPQPTPMEGGPGQLLMLRDGRLLCTYGRRKAPFGIRACLSNDGGRTWQIDSHIVIRDDMPNSDLGYPTTIEYDAGRLFCCYYGQTTDGVTCVQGTHVRLDA